MNSVRLRPIAVMGAVALAVSVSGCGAGGTPHPRAGEFSGANRPARPSPVPESLSCPSPTVPGAESVTTFRAGVDGACMSGDALLEYRCARRSAPVIQYGDESGTMRRFLGGKFTSVVAGLPGQAEFAGISSAGEAVFTGSSDRNMVFVRTRGVVRRWLRARRRGRRPLATPAGASALPSPSPIGSSTGPAVYLLGDSVLLAAQDTIEAGLQDWNVTFDALVGRSTPEALSIVQGQAPYVRGAVVIHVGENDLADPDFANQVAEIMRALKNAPLVLWVNLHESIPLYAELNRQLRNTVSRFPNGVVASWNAVAPADGIVSDGIHLNDLGAQAFGDLVLDYLLQWRAVAYERGPASCRSLPALPSPSPTASLSP